jgi:hypothetical protein
LVGCISLQVYLETVWLRGWKCTGAAPLITTMSAGCCLSSSQVNFLAGRHTQGTLVVDEVGPCLQSVRLF